MLPVAFYQDTDVLKLAKALLGKLLLTRIEGHLTGGYITETEGYAGTCDRASHAYNNRRTDRTEVMYRAGGIAYVYLCYGIHHLLNVVTGPKETPHAVLIRALKPVIGEDIMFQRRGKKPLTHGPGALTQALGITLKQNGQPLNGPTIWIEEGIKITSITVASRIGVDYAGDDAHLPYRFIGKCAILDS